MQPTEFNDIVAALALYRPRPMGDHADLDYVYEPGEFELMIGRNSADVQTVRFSLE